VCRMSTVRVSRGNLVANVRQVPPGVSLKSCLCVCVSDVSGNVANGDIIMCVVRG
jgi:hypothetical protein